AERAETIVAVRLVTRARNIGARAECLPAGTRQHDATRLAAGFEGIERVEQFFQELHRGGVDGRTVERYPRCPLHVAHLECFICHSAPSCSVEQEETEITEKALCCLCYLL